MSTMTKVPDDHPLMIAWSLYQGTEEYANTRQWAMQPEHVDGSLWAAFCEGWKQAQAAQHAALEFYAKPEHWMGITEDAESATVLVASGPTGEADGFAEARAATLKGEK